MRSYEIKFSGGKSCRCIVMEPNETEEQDIAQIGMNFTTTKVLSIERVVPPIPERVNWKKEGDCWKFGRFTMRKSESEKGEFELSWQTGSTKGDKDHISRMIRENWRDGC